MGYNARNDEIGDNITRMQRRWEAQREALATVRRFNATLSAKGKAWFWPKIAAALTANHHWLVINCDSCGTVMDLDLRVKPRDPEASIRVALRDVQCPRCNGHGRPRIIALARWPSIGRLSANKRPATDDAVTGQECVHLGGNTILNPPRLILKLDLRPMSRSRRSIQNFKIDRRQKYPTDHGGYFAQENVG